MSEELKDPSGMPVVEPAAITGEPTPTIDPADNETVSRRAYTKALTEKKAAQARLKELEDAEARTVLCKRR